MRNIKLIQKTYSDNKNFFIGFLNDLVGFQNKCKNLHWAAPKKNIHVYLDEFYDVLGDYTDLLAETYMGTEGQMEPNDIKPTTSLSINATDFIGEVKEKTLEFYNNIPEGPEYKGIVSDCESFLSNVCKYKYLFSLTDW